jgi:hypothetical protein
MFYVGHVDRVVYMKPFSTGILQGNIIIIIIHILLSLPFDEVGDGAPS